MSDELDAFLDARPVALVGASADPVKYGNIILRNLRGRGWEVMAINPKGAPIEGRPWYPTLADCPRRPALAVIVTPPQATLDILDQAKAAGVERIWFQDGSWTPEILARARQLGLLEVHGACIMVMAARRN